MLDGVFGKIMVRLRRFYADHVHVGLQDHRWGVVHPPLAATLSAPSRTTGKPRSRPHASSQAAIRSSWWEAARHPVDFSQQRDDPLGASIRAGVFCRPRRNHAQQRRADNEAQ